MSDDVIITKKPKRKQAARNPAIAEMKNRDWYNGLNTKNTYRPIKPDVAESEKSFHEIDIDPDDNRRYLRFALDAYHLPPLDISNPVKVAKRIDDYFEHCLENGFKPGISGICGYLGISRQTFYAWSVGDSKAATHTEIAQKARAVIENMLEMYMLNGKVNPVTGIFFMKNNFGYVDRTDIAVAPSENAPVDEKQVADVIDVYCDPQLELKDKEQNGRE